MFCVCNIEFVGSGALCDTSQKHNRTFPLYNDIKHTHAQHYISKANCFLLQVKYIIHEYKFAKI